MPSDVFPATLNTWIGVELDRGSSGRLNVNHYLMSTYAWPLKVYFLGTNSRWLGEPEDVVNGFFASRLEQKDFLGKWQASGFRLRRWLMNSFSYFLMEERRRHKKQKPADHSVEEEVTFSGDPDSAFDRAAAVGFVRQAMTEAEQACQEDRLEDHWRIFIRHHLEGVGFAELGEEYGVDAARATVMARTATRKFRAALHDVLERDGVARERIDEEIQLLVKEIG